MTNKCGSCGTVASSATVKFCTQCGNKLGSTPTSTSTPLSKSTTSTTSTTNTAIKPRPVSTYIPKSTTSTTTTSSSSLHVTKSPSTTASKPLPPSPSTTTTTSTSFTPKSILKPTTTISTTSSTIKPASKPTTTTSSTPSTTTSPFESVKLNRVKSHTVNYGKESPVKTTEVPSPPPKEWTSSGGSFVKMAAKSRETLDAKAIRDTKILSGQPVPETPPTTIPTSKSSLNISHKKAVSSPDPIGGSSPSQKLTLAQQQEKQAQLEKQIQLDKEKFLAKEKEAEKLRQHQLEKDKEAERHKQLLEKEKQAEKERERQLELKKQQDKEKEKLEKEKQKQIDKDKAKQIEKEKLKALEKEKEKERLASQEKLLEKEKEKSLDKERKADREREKHLEKEREKIEHEREKQAREREKFEKEREKTEKEREKLRQQQNGSPVPTTLANNNVSSDDNNSSGDSGNTTLSDQIKNIKESSESSSDSPKRKTKHGSRFFSFILGDKDNEDDVDSLQISSPNPNQQQHSNSIGRDSLESSNNSVNSEHTTNSEDQDGSGSSNGDAPLRKWAMKRNELQTSNGNLLGNISPNPSSPNLMMGTSRISSPDPPPTLIELPPATDHRSKVIEEIIVTENDYIRDLEIMVWLKKEMVIQDESSKLNSLDEINALFSNVEQLLLVNKELYNTFSDSKYTDLGDAIAHGFKIMSAFLKSYFVYCSNQQKALATYSALRGKNASYLAYLLTRRECRSLPFDSFLIKPIQRVCKYPLLIRELIKSTAAQSNSHSMLLAAQSAIENIVLDVNDKKREFDQQMRMYEIQKRLNDAGQDYKLLSPSRKLIKEGAITSWGFTVPGQPNSQYNKKPKDGFYYLFNDLFLYTQVKSSLTDDNSSALPLKLKAEIPLHVSLVKDIQEPSNSFELIYSIQQIWMFSLSTPEEKQSLFTEIDNCIEINLQSAYKKYLEEKQQQQNQINNSQPNLSSSPSTNRQSQSPITTKSQSSPTLIGGSLSSGTLTAQVESYDEWRKLVRNKPLPSLPPTGSPSLNKGPPKALPPPPPPSLHSSFNDIKIV
ncbi:pleckstrin (PH) domain-containing protein [Tieghemostelium lacteum]|uniref:Pleckstrin (PH) domain-containing protein n=1 Tax=Tieghemostelium lacteum TaxID=361077 RepID=A0A151ZFC1_TIELA|nr:pleckstrin (PH) domain-containing protein [Tieghemostelium lacteum]|eukprot:KYQ92627.1 pleckstrin (PH) domain-containing protein [Tieghemostelium lacteum]